jgi:N-methylhydantoinase A
VLRPFDRAQAAEVARQVRASGAGAVVVSFLHSYVNPAHELEMEKVLREVCPEFSVTLSHRLTREYREYERTSTAVIDAYIKPIMESYLDRLDGALRSEGFQGRFLLTRSGGGAMTVAAAKEEPVHSVMSGPAGGAVGAAYLAQLTGHPNLITLDMGGTSLDTTMVVDGQISIDNEASIETLPISTPMIDIRTIGAGGGSIAWIDEGGALQVGPQSAGALPGPACYGRGGGAATFTDAALVVGYLDAVNFLGGQMQIQAELAEAAVRKLSDRLSLEPAEAAAGIVRIAEAKITGAIREISVERGHHPKDFAILAFGGGGGFVACNVAREIGIPKVVVPPGPANFSAFGMLMVDVVYDYARTQVMTLEEADMSALERLYAAFEREGADALVRDGFDPERHRFVRWAEMRYEGQEHTVRIPLPEKVLTSAAVPAIARRFGEAHEMQYGHRMDDPVQFVTLRVRAMGVMSRPAIAEIPVGTGDVSLARKGTRQVYRQDAGGRLDYAVYDRALLGGGDRVAGPAIVEEPSYTLLLHHGDVMTVGRHGELVIAIGGKD